MRRGSDGAEAQHLRGTRSNARDQSRGLCSEEDTITFAYEGEEMDEKKTIKERTARVMPFAGVCTPANPHAPQKVLTCMLAAAST